MWQLWMPVNLDPSLEPKLERFSGRGLMLMLKDGSPSAQGSGQGQRLCLEPVLTTVQSLLLAWVVEVQ